MREFFFGWIGWVFCEIAFNTPDWLWWALGWTYSVGTWAYGIAYPVKDAHWDDVAEKRDEE